MDKEAAKIIDDLRIENNQLQTQLRDALSTLDKLQNTSSFPQSMWENQHLNPDKENGEGEVEEFEKIYSWLCSETGYEIHDKTTRAFIINAANMFAESYATSHIKKKVKEVTGDEIFKYVNKYTDTNVKVTEVDAIECVLHFLTQLVR